jgi:hypothetical protein
MTAKTTVDLWTKQDERGYDYHKDEGNHQDNA